MTQKQLETIASQFKIKGKILSVSALGNGLINDTYKINTEGDAPDYVLQKINNKVFTDVDLLQSNIEAVTRHIRKQLEAASEKDIDRKVLTFIESGNGKTYIQDESGFWRVSLFIDKAKTFETVNPEYSYYAGKAFGDFEARLTDLPDKLGETIPDFHNMELRVRQFAEALEQDAAGRVHEALNGGDPSIREIIDKITSRAEHYCLAEQLYREGKLPKRICHCDTKVNNMMFDEEGNVLCVIDLDTVMPSFVFSDFGDFLRTAANTGDEDDKNLDNVSFNMEIFNAFSKGYLESAGTFLTPIERENLPFAACLFPYMQAVRFFTDYINGDTYYKIQYPDHNLVRTKAQIKLLESAESHLEEMKKIISNGQDTI
ncbi:MAG: aminoglycoside phosphotransferase family protein [Bacteroidales bacterium]